MRIPTSCGTVIVNPSGELLLCHVTNTSRWDIPKGMQDPGESPLEAARRELREEAGLMFEAACFNDLGSFVYRPEKRLHLFLVRAPVGLLSLAHLSCSSFFIDTTTGIETPEVDCFRWARRSEIEGLCWPRMGKRLLSLDW